MCVYVFVQYICSPSCQDVFSLDNTVAKEVVSAAVVMLNSLFTCNMYFIGSRHNVNWQLACLHYSLFAD